GMPVMLMPFLITQNNSFGRRSLTTSLRSGGSGCSPSENFAHSTPGAPWQFQQPRAWNAFAPAWMLAGLSIGIGGASAAWRLIEAVRALGNAPLTTAESSRGAATPEDPP